jgi:hypothetical protein
MISANYLAQNKFIKIGEYSFRNNEMIRDYKKFTNEKLSTRKKLVYAFVVDDIVKYFGKTNQGYKRPLSYHKDFRNLDKKRNVHIRIRETIKNNKIIEVFIRELVEIPFENLNINPYVAYEESLIEQFSEQLWNQ